MTINNAAIKTIQELQKLGVRTTNDYFEKFSEILLGTNAILLCSAPNTDTSEYPLSANHGINFVVDYLLENRASGKKIMAIGNGGSAAIAIHTLVDYANAGGLKTADFYGPALLTCMANDYGYENVFVKPIELFAEPRDMLFAISSSGKSPNILKACEIANSRLCRVITFSGFEDDNPLRHAGIINFYVPSTHYGFVELAHQTLLHCILDLFIKKGGN